MLFNGKIKVLGIEFDSEEARRDYFRNELRKQLPELKKIDGFPIGEDEDIIDLSDPPFYTACPNPWLNDFIQEWEAEKATIPNRSQDFVVDEPYSADVTEGKNNPIYNAHSYHTKVPHPAIMRFLLHYTQPGDIVLDGFAGTGMTGVATQMCGNPEPEFKAKMEKEWKDEGKGEPNWGIRNAIIGDLSPIASFISYNFNTQVDLEEFLREAQQKLKELFDEYGWMNKTIAHPNPEKPNTVISNEFSNSINKSKTLDEIQFQFKESKNNFGKINYSVWSEVLICSECGSEIIYWDAAYNTKTKEVNEILNCSNCNANNTKRNCEKSWITEFDEALGETIRHTKFVPVLLNYSVGTKRYEKKPDSSDVAIINKIHEFYNQFWFPKDRMPEGGESRRNDRIGISHVHHFYTKTTLFILSAYLSKISSLKKELRKQLKFIFTSVLPKLTKMNRYMPQHGSRALVGPMANTLYIPPLFVSNNVNDQLDFQFKKIIQALILKNKSISFISSATDLKYIPNETIDYIFTDPPFGANIMYSELSFISESWLRIKTNNQKEAIENSAQNKNVMDYQNLILESLKEYYRVLKPGKWLTVEFSNTQSAIWNTIQASIQRSGFIISSIFALDKERGGLHSMTSLTAVKQDLIISCYKPSKVIIDKFEEGNQNGKYLWDWVNEHLNHLPVHLTQGQRTTSIVERTPKIIFDRLITYYLIQGLKIPTNAKEFQEGLIQRFAERDGMFFTLEQSVEYDRKKSENPELVNLSLWIGSESEGIEWLRAKLSEKLQTYQQLQPEWMKSITAIRKNDVLPELRDLLNENFINEPNGQWRVPDMNEAKDRETLRNRTLLKEFEIYKAEIAKPKGKIKEARVEALRAGFKFCWETYEYKTIVDIADKIPNNLLMEDEQLLMYYDMAMDRL
jgi:DNA modification methylase